MPDVVGYRAKLGVVIPATNTVVEHDFNKLAPAGVTIHSGRIDTPVTNLDSDEAFIHFLDTMRRNIGAAVQSVMNCEPDLLVMGMSSETFMGGVAGNAAFERQIAQSVPVTVLSGARALDSSLRRLGAHRLCVVTPYQPAIDREVRRFLAESGYDVVNLCGLECDSATAIARVTPEEILASLGNAFDPRCDALVQVGTNLAVLDVIEIAEQRFDRPFVGINVALMRDDGAYLNFPGPAY